MRPRYQGRLYYRCVGNVVHRLSKQRVCHSQSLRGEKLEAAIWADVSALLAEPQRIEEEYQRRLNIGNEAKEPPSQHKLQMQTSRVQRQISKLIDAYSEGLIEKQEFEPRIREARHRLEKLQAEAQTQEQWQAQRGAMRQVIGHLQAFAERVRDSLETADWALQRQLISTLVKRVEVGSEEVRVVYRVDCGPFESAPSGGPVAGLLEAWQQSPTFRPGQWYCRRPKGAVELDKPERRERSQASARLFDRSCPVATRDPSRWGQLGSDRGCGGLGQQWPRPAARCFG